MQLFNKTFYKFTLGFLGILALAFVLAAYINHLDKQSLPASAEQIEDAK